MGPTLVAYLRGVGARAVGAVEVTTTEVEAGIAGALWLATVIVVGAVATTVGAATAATVGVRSKLGLDPPTGGGEEWRTWGLKLCPPACFTMNGQEKGRR